MHRTLFALVLAAYLFATDPSGVLARFWGRGETPVSATLEKTGPGLDPNGAAAPVRATKAGPGLDPDGRSSSPTPLTYR
jgi:hypothetical protein